MVRSIILAAGTVAAVSLLGGVALYASIALLCAVVFVAPAYIQARRTETLLLQSLTDPLTGIGNRRALLSRLEQEIARCSRGGYSVTVLMIDVDKLKQINDAAGHQAGDAVLRIVASALRDSTRVSDVVGRFGGDEFLVIAPQTTEAFGCALAERIAAKAHKSFMANPRARRASLSIGVATASSTTADMLSLLESADRSMYRAKQQGGNAVVAASHEHRQNVVPLRPISGP